MYDIIIIGGGPAGLSAAINTSSDGLKTAIVSPQIGGQAGHSHRIENYLGFPDGVSGKALTEAAWEQASRFGTEFIKSSVLNVEPVGGNFNVTTNLGLYTGRSVLVASGLEWLRCSILDAHTDNLVIYGGTAAHARNLRVVMIVGGGNAAGQAALGFYKGGCELVHLVCRSKLSKRMSDYLERRIRNCHCVAVHEETPILEIDEKNRVILEKAGHPFRLDDVEKIYPYLGGRPNIGWLPPGVERDEHGYVIGRANHTSVPGIFVAGDIRAGATRAVASAVGDGRCAAGQIFDYLCTSCRA